MRVTLPLILFVCLTTGMQISAGEEPVRSHLQQSQIQQSPIQQWVLQLGDESFLVRERAEMLLIHAGIQAYHELRRAEQSRDFEVARRAEYILSQIEHHHFDTTDEAVSVWIENYMAEHNPAAKARIIWALADPTLDLRRGEGLHTLYNLVLFEESAALRLEAAKTLIAHSPVSLMLRRQWFQQLQNTFQATDDNTLHQTLAHYAQLWCDLDEADARITPELQERVRQVSAQTLRLLERPENAIQIGSVVDMMLHYAVAELQDAAGLTEDRDRTVAVALAIIPEPIRTTEPLMPWDHVDNALLMFEHYRVAWCLRLRFRLHWAIAHFQKVIETGEMTLRVMACASAAQTALYFADYALVADFLTRQIEILGSPEFRRQFDPTQQIALAQKRKTYCLAQIAFAEENWEKVQELLTEAWSMPNAGTFADDFADVDLVLLAHHLSERHDVTREFADMKESALLQLWRSTASLLDHIPSDRLFERIPTIGNNAAWLLANTGGDFQSALTLVQAALRIEPDNVHFLDTLAHVYFLGGNIDEAIRIQEQVVRLAPEADFFWQVLERFRQAKES